MNRSPRVIAFAVLFAAAVPALGYALLGWLPAVLFGIGYGGGFLLWLMVRRDVPWASMKAAYWVTLGLFVLHRAEEGIFGFFPALSRVTGVPVPEFVSWPVIALVLLAAAWLLVPALVRRGYAFGYFLAWTFFAAMGITELAHFVFPLMVPGPYRYFPGMLTVVLLAPAAWWGMGRLARGAGKPSKRA